MTPHQFIATWKKVELSERSACQSHFNDLCALLGEPQPTAADPTGAWFTFEKGVDKSGGGKGFADVWRRGFFGWEYKGKHKDLTAAYQQLLKYREALENPPLLIVCDLNRFEVHTNFPNTVKKVHAFDLDGLADAANLDTLRRAFTNPGALAPGTTPDQITREVARRFGRLADGLRGRGADPHRAAHFLMKLMFCMFAEDVELLPPGLFRKTVLNSKCEPVRFSKLLRGLFAAMAAGDTFGADEIAHFNGGLFADADVIDLHPDEIRDLLSASDYDWAGIDPSIFGTVFERILDPAKRSQTGAHYTSGDDIRALLGPVLLAPLRREWDAVRARADRLWEKAKGAKVGSKPRRDFETCVNDFLYRLAHTVVLDPACGSGNFLYVAIRMLLDLEKEVLTYAAARDQRQRYPTVLPTQLRGIEINPYAQQLAQVVIWIGYLQWRKENGYWAHRTPILDPMESIEHRDAVLDRSDPANPKEPDWPDAEFVVGNPPFLGDKKMRAELGDDYVEALRELYADRLPGQSDLCCYWFEKARALIETGHVKRAGLLATQGIRGGANRTCLDRIKETGDIFFGVSDRDWVLDGAHVHVSIIGFDDGTEKEKARDGAVVSTIHSDLKAGGRPDVTRARLLSENADRCFLGVMKAGSFDISEATAMTWLQKPNPHGRPNSDVLRPRLTARDILQRAPIGWIIDFGCDSPAGAAALYEEPWKHVESVVKPERVGNRRTRLAERWWLHGEPRPGLRNALDGLSRFGVTPEVSKHRVFVWLDDVYLADHQTRAFADSTDYTFGVLQSAVHELWARSKGTQLRDVESGFRYTPTTCFETFPFPEPTPAQQEAIAAAARHLDGLRTNWLHPPEWTRTETLEFPGSADGPWKRYVTGPDARGVGTVRYPRLVPKDAASAAQLKKRTLTALYNERPAWLANAHRALDAAVAAAYGWPPDRPDDEVLARLLALNLSRADG